MWRYQGEEVNLVNHSFGVVGGLLIHRVTHLYFSNSSKVM